MDIPNNVRAAVHASEQAKLVAQVEQARWASALSTSHMWHRNATPRARAKVEAHAIHRTTVLTPSQLRAKAAYWHRYGNAEMCAIHVRAYLKATRG